MAKAVKTRAAATSQPSAIAQIQVAGFKSIRDEQAIEIRPLTILAGANSSGKSSMMQPLLLLKQTLEAPYDPGPLLLNGPNVKFTSTEQLLSRTGRRHSTDGFEVGMQLTTGDGFLTRFRKEHKMGFGIEQMDVSGGAHGELTFWPGMTRTDIVKTGITKGLDFSQKAPAGHKEGQWEIRRDRCFIGPVWVANGANGTSISYGVRPGPVWEETIPSVIHLPGLRGNPERSYPVSAVGPKFPGTFEKYTASVLAEWMDTEKDVLGELNRELKLLKLTGGVTALRVNDVQIEVHVGRLPDIPPTRLEDRVNIADVGVGVSQTLPVLVALYAARPQMLVYVEQPEAHLHPRAQFVLAEVLAAAAERGVRLVVETHSSLLLMGVQALVAEGRLSPEKVKLHWFQRDKEGSTLVRSADLDEAGRFGEWPEDFDDVTLQAQKRYLDAAEKQLFAQ